MAGRLQFTIFTSVTISLIFLILTQPFRATASLECEEEWDGPHPNNTLRACRLDYLYLSRAPPVIAALIPALILAWALLFYPCFFIGRQCFGLCGSNRRRPGHFCGGGREWDGVPAEHKEAHYSRAAVALTKACTVLMLLLGIGSMILMLVGASKLQSGQNQFWRGFLGPQNPNLVTFTEQKVHEADIASQHPDGTYVNGLSNTTFINAMQGVDDLRGDLESTKNSIDGILVPLTKLTYALGVIPLLFLVLAVIMAAFNIRTFGPACLTCCFFVLLFIYCNYSFALNATGFVMWDGCDEINLHYWRKPGIFQWWIVPRCEVYLDFATLQADVRAAERNNAIAGCNSMLSICDSTFVFNQSNPKKVFQCLVNNTEINCNAAAKYEPLFDASIEKEGANACFPAGTEFNPCTMRRCVTDCLGSENRAAAAAALKSLEEAKQASIVNRGPVDQLYDCSVLMDKSFLGFNKCRSLAVGLLVAGSGATIFAFVFALGICTMFKGQKHFFHRRPELEHGELTSEQIKMQEESPKRRRRLAAMEAKRGVDEARVDSPHKDGYSPHIWDSHRQRGVSPQDNWESPHREDKRLISRDVPIASVNKEQAPASPEAVNNEPFEQEITPSAVAKKEFVEQYVNSVRPGGSQISSRLPAESAQQQDLDEGAGR